MAALACQCNNIVRHCHDWLDRFIATDEAEDLQQGGTLAGVIKQRALINIANENEARSSASAASIIPPVQLPPPASPPLRTRTLRRHPDARFAEVSSRTVQYKLTSDSFETQYITPCMHVACSKSSKGLF